MAKKDFNNLDEKNNITENSDYTNIADSVTPENNGQSFVANTTNGLNEQKIQDPNSIDVTLVDTNVPIVVLFGPTECGKTMTLIRMTRFLKKYGYEIEPVRSFRPSEDSHYKEMCKSFDSLVNSTNAAGGTEKISFMLVDVLSKGGKKICQILEAPGEYYYNPKNPDAEFPTYVRTIITAPNRKIWIFMVEPDWKNKPDRDGYVSKIKALKIDMRPHDRAIFLYNKVDASNFVISPGRVNMGGIKRNVENMYPGIFTPFVNTVPIVRFLKPYLCDLVSFSNGTFPKAQNSAGEEYIKYIEGAEEYPRMLWNVIMKRIRG